MPIIVKLGSWSWSVVKVKFKIHSQKRTRADFIIQMHLSPPTRPTTFKQQYKGQKTRKRTRSIAMLALNQQLTITHNPPPSRWLSEWLLEQFLEWLINETILRSKVPKFPSSQASELLNHSTSLTPPQFKLDSEAAITR